MSDNPPTPEIEPARKNLMERFSIVWLVPIGALLISLGIVWQNYLDRGPVITIAFDNASGVHADETELRYRDVTVGLVEGVSFSDGLGRVLVEVRLEKELAPYVDADSQFWVVRPEVSAQGVTGLDTVLSGVFIEGSWDTDPEGLSREFEGRSDAPLRRPGQAGLTLTLRAADSDGLAERAPILYRGIAVGRIDNLRLADDGVSVLADAFIREPESRLVTTATRFWDASGFRFSIGAQGADLEVQSLASLLTGGIAFDTFVSGGTSVSDGALFALGSSEAEAREAAFSAIELGARVSVQMIFEGNVGGLSAGDPVEFLGVRVGEIVGLTGLVDAERFGDRVPRLVITVDIDTGRMGMPPTASEAEAIDFLDALADHGLRGQLQSASLLGTGRKVVLVDIEDARPAALRRDAEPLPIFPTVPSEESDIAATAEGVFNRINELPIEELLTSAINALDSVNRLLNDPELVATPGEVRGLVGDVRDIVGSDEVQNLPGQAATALASLARSTDTLEQLLTQLEEAQAVETLTAALEAAREAAESASAASEGLPGIVDRLDALATTAAELPLEDLAREADAFLATARELIGSEDARQVPASLNGALSEIETALVEIRAAGVIENTNDTLTAAEQAANSIADASGDLPGLVDRIRALTVRAEDTLSGYSANARLGQDARAALREVREAAEAVNSLARAIEREPNSLLLGR